MRSLLAEKEEAMTRQRQPIIAGNWKMNMTATQARDMIAKLIPLVDGVEGREIVIAPPFTSIPAISAAAAGTGISISGQNMHWEDKGPFTGEISAEMLLDLGCKYVIIGHSERRQYFGETDESVNKKVRQAVRKGLRPIVCVGETLSERESGRVDDVIKRQVSAAFDSVSGSEMNMVVIAYEPVWAIGTGKTASPEQANDVHSLIRGIVREAFGAEAADSIRIQYGGSVTLENISSLMSRPDIDGALVGGASLKPDSFAAIAKFA